MRALFRGVGDILRFLTGSGESWLGEQDVEPPEPAGTAFGAQIRHLHDRTPRTPPRAA